MTFDPYEQWLQIAADRRPPSYYDLLGLPEFEADFARIHQAGIERIAYVRRFQLGQHAAAAIQLLGELARAFDGLSTPERKAAYDERLRRWKKSAAGEAAGALATTENIAASKPHETLGAASPGLPPPADSGLFWAGAGVGLGLLFVVISIVTVRAFPSPKAPSSEPTASPFPARFVQLGEQTVDEGRTLEVPLSIGSSASTVDAVPESAGWMFRLGAGAPRGAQIDERSGVFSWKPDEDQAGLYRIVVAAEHDGEAELRTELHVTVRKVYSPPELAPIADATIDEEKRFELTVAASDADVPPTRLTFSLAPGFPEGMHLDPKTGRLSWTPNEMQGPGTYLVGVRVSDDASPPGVAEQSFSISVREVNRPPVFEPIDDVTVNLYDLAALPLKATDPDLPKNKLAFSLEGEAPSDAKIDADSQMFLWRPPASHYGKKQKFSVRVVDDAASPLEARASFVIDVGRVATNSVGMKLVYIQPGEFRMGWDTRPDDNQEAAHRILIERPFYLGQCEVTVNQFAQFVEAASYYEPERDPDGSQAFDSGSDRFRNYPAANWRKHHFEQTGDHPVVDVSWNDARRFCDWLTRREGRLYRLPMEAEWEYCCRSGTTTAFSSGDDDSSLKKFANLADVFFFNISNGEPTPSEKPFVMNSGKAATWSDGFVFTAPVGSFLPNGFGIHDMYGNVAEWCDDAFGDDKVARGGSFFSSPAGVRSAQRYWHSPDLRRDDLGFRVVADGPDPISPTPLR